MSRSYRFTAFSDLAREKTEGIDFTRSYTPRNSPVLILAPHGGKIELHTSTIATSLAGEKFALYLFEGVQDSNNLWELHISSSNFDEPTALKAVAQALYVVAVHGYGDEDDAYVMVGGLDTVLQSTIRRSLDHAGFKTLPCKTEVAGLSRNNICNRNARSRGCQLEISYLLRCKLVDDDQAMERFVDACWSGIEQVKERG